MALPGALGPPLPPPTVLIAVRTGLGGTHRPPPLPPGPALRLQLSVQPGTSGQRRFRLGLRLPEPPGAAPIAEYDLKDISYRVRTPTCHELTLPSATDEPVLLTFEEEQEAQRWWTIVSSSLREVQKASESLSGSLVASVPAVAGASSTDPSPEVDPSLELAETEELALQLAKAIELGDEEEASRCALALARQQVPLSIRPREPCYPSGEIRMKVGVEDATSSASITLRVRPHSTIAALKQQVFQDYGFHPLVQRWIIGQCLCVDERSLFSYGVRADGDPAFLFLLAARAAQLTEQCYEDDQARVMLSSTSAPTSGHKYNTLPCVSTQKGWRHEASRKLNIGDIRQYLDTLQLEDHSGATPQPAATNLPSPVPTGWSCPKCTFINKPTRPGCEMCSSARPDDYVVPGGYEPDEMELRRMQQEQEGIRQYQQALEAERQQNLQQLLELEAEVLVATQEEQDCLICFQKVPPGQGVLLRECLHSFCRECLRQVVTHSEEPAVACPFRDDSYNCSSHLQEREIRALVSPEEYRHFLERSLVLAERRSPNSFHCQTSDCRGWCIYEDSVNEFRCPICHALNCLLCKAIHEGQNCRQYQEELRLRAQNDAAARQTSDMLQTLVQRGEAMHCPTCLIVVQKKDGCDWIRCTVCQTEICWVTKGPRWGPGGPGDTSAGCRCNVNGQRCHPQCRNCH